MLCSPPPRAAVCGGATVAPPLSLSGRSNQPPHHHLLTPLTSPLLRRPSVSPATENEKTLATITRRSILASLPFLISPPAISGAGSPLELVQYTDPAAGFTLLRPSSWNQVGKAGATALFEEGKGKNNIGVVVNPVRLASLLEFGTPEFVAEKLIKAEKKKESTKDAELKSIAERLGHSGLPVYEFEYTVDSTRGGMKRIFSAAFVASKKLYLLNIAYSDRPEDPLDNKTRMVLEQILHSFDTA